jgi:hypothetical protein
MISTFSCDIARAVSRGIGEGAEGDLPAQKTAGWLAARADQIESERLMSAREHRITVRLNDQEAARFDELRGDVERPVYLRQLLYGPPKRTEAARHDEALAILSRLARDGRTSAAIALERALRHHPGRNALSRRPQGGTDFDDELSRLLDDE